MTVITCRPIKVWPDGWTGRTNRPASPFQAGYTATLDLLDRELEHLGAVIQVDAVDADIRLDGRLRADAKVRHPGVILTIETKAHGTLVYATDRFDGTWGNAGWQANLRAIALGLEALRRIERYGIAERGQQYAGYRELGPAGGDPRFAAGPAALDDAMMTVEHAARILAEAWAPGAGMSVEGAVDELLVNVGGEPSPWIGDAYRAAAKQHHPDVGGSPEYFRTLTAARDLLLQQAQR